MILEHESDDDVVGQDIGGEETRIISPLRKEKGRRGEEYRKRDKEGERATTKRPEKGPLFHFRDKVTVTL